MLTCSFMLFLSHLNQVAFFFLGLKAGLSLGLPQSGRPLVPCRSVLIGQYMSLAPGRKQDPSLPQTCQPELFFLVSLLAVQTACQNHTDSAFPSAHLINSRCETSLEAHANIYLNGMKLQFCFSCCSLHKAYPACSPP